MADSSISALASAGTLDGTEIIPVVKGGANKRTTVDAILARDTDPVTSVNTLTGVVTLTQDTIGDGTTYKQYSNTDKTKLAGIATSATANSSDATLLARANHTGTQTASTVSDFSTAADARITAAVGVSVQAFDSTTTKNASTQTLTNKTISGASNTLSNIGVTALSATGTPSATTYLRGDNTWATPAGGGGGTWGSITGTLSAQTDLQTALDAKQTLDTDLTTIAGLTATTDSFMQSKSSAWASRTLGQVRTDLEGQFNGLTIKRASAPFFAISGSTPAATSGQPYLQAIWLEKGDVVTNLFALAATTCSTLTHSWMALCSGALNAPVIAAISADNVTATWTADSARTFTMGSPYTVTTAGWFYMALCTVGTGTMPSFYGASFMPSFIGGSVTGYGGFGPFFGRSGTSGLTTPPAVSTSLSFATGVAGWMWGYST